jgi:hypothetical protein
VGGGGGCNLATQFREKITDKTLNLQKILNKQNDVVTIQFLQISRTVSLSLSKISPFSEAKSRIHERTISLRFLDIILRVLSDFRTQFLHYKPVSSTFAQGGRVHGRGSRLS